MRISSLQHQKCFITGAASGIGRAVAIRAAAEGAELFLTDINAQALEAVAREIREAGGRVSQCRALDIADHAAVTAFADSIHAAHGSLDIIMNIAGVSIWGTIEHLSHEDWRRTIDINLMGPVHVMEAFIPPMIRAGRGGYLVNVSSAAGLFGLPWHAAYSASKFGLRGISEVLRFDLHQHGIGVSLVCPGGVDTGLVRTIQIRGIDNEDAEIAALKKRFQRHAVTPDQAAQAILRGIKQGRYMVYTSADIRWGHWFQRKLSLPYEVVMQLMNNYLHRVAERQRARR